MYECLPGSGLVWCSRESGLAWPSGHNTTNNNNNDNTLLILVLDDNCNEQQ